MKVENQGSEATREDELNCTEEEEGVRCLNETVRRRDDRQDDEGGLAEGVAEEQEQAQGALDQVNRPLQYRPWCVG